MNIYMHFYSKALYNAFVYKCIYIYLFPYFWACISALLVYTCVCVCVLVVKVGKSGRVTKFGNKGFNSVHVGKGVNIFLFIARFDVAAKARLTSPVLFAK